MLELQHATHCKIKLSADIVATVREGYSGAGVQIPFFDQIPCMLYHDDHSSYGCQLTQCTGPYTAFRASWLTACT